MAKSFDRAEALKALQEAQLAAAEAAQGYLDKIGGDQYPCGFAWVNLKPARGPLVTLMKELQLGKTDEYAGGFAIWNPSNNHCQNVDAKEAGARAFTEVMKKHGVNFTVGTRWD